MQLSTRVLDRPEAGYYAPPLLRWLPQFRIESEPVGELAPERVRVD